MLDLYDVDVEVDVRGPWLGQWNLHFEDVVSPLEFALAVFAVHRNRCEILRYY